MQHSMFQSFLEVQHVSAAQHAASPLDCRGRGALTLQPGQQLVTPD